MINLTLDLPPSVNALYTNVRGKGRVLSKAGKAWKEKAAWQVAHWRYMVTPGHANIGGPVAISIVFVFPNPRSDIDGPIKPLLDLLVSMRIIEDDKQVIRLAVEKQIGEASCTVSVEEIQ